MIKTPLLERLTNEEKNLLLENTTPFHVERGNFIFLEGDPADRIFFIKHGIVNVKKYITKGKEITIFMRTTNDAFGEIGPFSGSTYSCSAHAEGPTELYFIKYDDLYNLFVNNGRIAAEFVNWVAESLETSSSKLKDYLMFNAEGAVASVIIRLSNMYGRQFGSEVMINTSFTNYTIGTHVGISRETVNRIVNEWKNQGVIEISSKKIIIKNIDYLKNILGCDKCGVHNCVL